MTVEHLTLTCHPSPSLTTLAFMSREVTRLLFDLDPYGGTDALGMFPLFLQRTADVMAPRLSVVFRRLVRLGSFPACWRQANVTPIPKGPPSSFVANYRLISTTSVFLRCLSAMVSVRVERFMERSGVLPTTQFAYRKGWGTCDALLYVFHTLQSALESGQKRRLISVQPLIGSSIRAFSIALVCGYGRFCVVYTDTVSVKPITARYGGWLPE